jgi:hypothetical protein
MTNGFTILQKFKPTARAVVHEGDCRDMLLETSDFEHELLWRN